MLKVTDEKLRNFLADVYKHLYKHITAYKLISIYMLHIYTCIYIYIYI